MPNLKESLRAQKGVSVVVAVSTARMRKMKKVAAHNK